MLTLYTRHMKSGQKGTGAMLSRVWEEGAAVRLAPCCVRARAASYSAVRAHLDRALPELCIVIGILYVGVRSTLANNYWVGYALWGAWVSYPGRLYSGITYQGTTYPISTYPVTTYPRGYNLPVVILCSLDRGIITSAKHLLPSCIPGLLPFFSGFLRR